MARRNLRRWAEAKERRAQQYAAPKDRWSYGPGTPIFLEDAPFGTYCAPTAFLSMDGESSIAGPTAVFPDGIGEVLHTLLNSEPRPGPPFTHTFNLPPTEYDDDGEPLPPQIQPTMTVTRVVQDKSLANACDTIGWLLLYGPDLRLPLLDRAIDRVLAESDD